MLIIGDGTLCLMDGADAAIRSRGNWVNFFLRLNIVAWYRLVSEQYHQMLIMMEATNSEYELTILLRNEYTALGFELPYNGNFDDFMNDTSSVLEFK